VSLVAWVVWRTNYFFKVCILGDWCEMVRDSWICTIWTERLCIPVYIWEIEIKKWGNKYENSYVATCKSVLTKWSKPVGNIIKGVNGVVEPRIRFSDNLSLFSTNTGANFLFGVRCRNLKYLSRRHFEILEVTRILQLHSLSENLVLLAVLQIDTTTVVVNFPPFLPLRLDRC